jgi:hypothetical protein
MSRIVSHQREVVDDVGDWIDQYTIADLIYDGIKEEFGILPTVAQCQEVWYRCLDRLGELVRSSVRSLDIDFD